MNTKRLLNFRMSSRQLFLLYNAEVGSGMAFGGSEQISFYWLLNWPSRDTNRREAEQWRKKKGMLKILKGVNISLVVNGAALVYLIFGVHRQIFLNAKKICIEIKLILILGEMIYF